MIFIVLVIYEAIRERSSRRKTIRPIKGIIDQVEGDIEPFLEARSGGVASYKADGSRNGDAAGDADWAAAWIDGIANGLHASKNTKFESHRKRETDRINKAPDIAVRAVDRAVQRRNILLPTAFLPSNFNSSHSHNWNSSHDYHTRTDIESKTDSFTVNRQKQRESTDRQKYKGVMTQVGVASYCNVTITVT